MDRKQYRSYSKAVVAVVNDYFERQERLAADSYLETREKEDAFLRQVTEAIEQGLRFAHAGMLPIMPPAAVEVPSAEDDKNLSALWTLRTASDTTFAFVWYDCDTKWAHFCYYNDFQQRHDTKQMNIWCHAAINLIFTTKGRCSMTDNEKKLLQAKRRLEEAQMRDRQKERKARTRRLIQERCFGKSLSGCC